VGKTALLHCKLRVVQCKLCVPATACLRGLKCATIRNSGCLDTEAAGIFVAAALLSSVFATACLMADAFLVAQAGVVRKKCIRTKANLWFEHGACVTATHLEFQRRFAGCALHRGDSGSVRYREQCVSFACCALRSVCETASPASSRACTWTLGSIYTSLVATASRTCGGRRRWMLLHQSWWVISGIWVLSMIAK
jgi:hypothetical protein